MGNKEVQSPLSPLVLFGARHELCYLAFVDELDCFKTDLGNGRIWLFNMPKAG